MGTANLQDKINSWIEEQICAQAEVRLQYLLLKNYSHKDSPNLEDDTFGWIKRLIKYHDKSPEALRSRGGLLITGPEGCGKHTAASSVVNYLCSPYEWAVTHAEEKYECVFITQEDISCWIDDVKQVYDYLNALLDYYEGRKLVIVAENIEDDALGREFMRRLGQFACMFSTEQTFAHLYVIVISENEKIVPPILRERLLLCKMKYPDREDCLEFLKNNYELMTEITLYAEDENNSETVEELLDGIADNAEGMNYQQLKDLAQVISMELSSGGNDVIYTALSQQPDSDSSYVKEQFYLKMITLAENMPELIEKLGAAAKVTVLSDSDDEHEKKKRKKKRDDEEEEREDRYIRRDRKEEDNLTGEQIALDLFGEEGAGSLFQLAEETKQKRLNA